MNCEARIQLLNELSRAVAAYNQAVHRMVADEASLRFTLREQARLARENCNACRVALLEHEREHGCSIHFAASDSNNMKPGNLFEERSRSHR
jgi:hypothetical protein